MKKSNFWKNRSVLVTGYGGFLATALVEKLASQGAKVTAVTRTNKNLSSVKNVRLVVCDLTNISQVKKIILDSKPKTIFHLAGFAIVAEATKKPVETFYSNFITTLNILDALRFQTGVEFILASSDKVYGHHLKTEAEPLPFSEFYGLRGLDIYSSSKLCADVLTRAFAYQYKIKVAVIRSCNIYGPGDKNFFRLIPKTAKLLLSGQAPIVKQGHENILREYIYVEDAVNAYMLIGEKLNYYYGNGLKNMPKQGVQTIEWPVFNLGSYTKKDLKQVTKCENIKSVLEVIKVIQKYSRQIKPKVSKAPAIHIEIPDEFLDSTKLIKLGFKATTNFEQGIVKTINWYKDYFKHN